MGISDSSFTLLSSLTGTSKGHPIEVPSVENNDKTSKSLIGSAIKKEMIKGVFEFKAVCSHIVANEGDYLQFPMFMVGEHCWVLWCMYRKVGCLSFTLYVRSESKDLKMSVELGVLKKDEGPSSVKWWTITNTFKKCGDFISMNKFIERDELKQYLQDEYVRVICNLTILSETIISNHDVTILGGTRKPKINMTNGPPPYLNDHLSKLLQNKKRADVIFEVNGENFHAHKLVLAARSHVFNDKYFGPTNENKIENIKINGMEPRVFKAMLNFIYTDMLPDLNEGCKDVNKENNQTTLIQMFQHLLAAADHYALERLKLICEDKLSRSITVDTVATTLVLAEKHNCSNLKAICIEFITSPQYFAKVALTDGYANLLVSCPIILKELRANFNNMSL